MPGELGDGAARDQPTGVDDDDLVGEVLGLVHQVGGQHDRDAVAAQRLNELPGRPPGLRVEPGGRLVEEDQLGAADDRHRERQALLLPSREPTERGPLDFEQAQPGQEVNRIQWVAVIGGDQAQQLAGAQPRGAAGRLRHHAHAGPQGPVSGIAPEYPDGAAVGGAEALAHLDRRGLAGTVRAEQGEDRAPPDREGQAVDGGPRAVSLDEADDLERGVGHAASLGGVVWPGPPGRRGLGRRRDVFR